MKEDLLSPRTTTSVTLAMVLLQYLCFREVNVHDDWLVMRFSIKQPGVDQLVALGLAMVLQS